MTNGRRWDPCVAHRDSDLDTFLDDYFTQTDRSVLLVAGAGFDPRACAVAARLRETDVSIRALLLREHRPDPPPHQAARADTNTATLRATLETACVQPVQVFDSDGAVVGGRKAVDVLRRQDLQGVTDVVVDLSALSVGTGFPIVRYFVDCVVPEARSVNLHVFVTHDPLLDARVQPQPSDKPGYVHGFKSQSTLLDMADVARLWLPQLATGRRRALRDLHDFIDPHDTCPILPFPASDPRLGDMLAEEYLTELEATWRVDAGNIVHADEGDPLDLYRTILKLHDLRQPVFEETGGSVLILSPLGSKVMALGALLAALERDLPVAHLEPLGYDVEESLPVTTDSPCLIHLWLEGDVYPQPRPPLPSEASPSR
ncbi:MAG: hypothetical protein F4W89_01245 [Acidobacteria bacterium]|nr:hypothetical protein [Acidobacteriota bacterium]